MDPLECGTRDPNDRDRVCITVGSGESGVNFPVTLRAHRPDSSDSQCHLFCILSVH